MNYIKWEVIKRNAQREFVVRVGPPHGVGDSALFLALIEQISSGKPARDVLEDWITYGLKLIDDWDVRGVGRLAEIFPGCIPVGWRGRRFNAEMLDNETSDWVIYAA